MANKSDSKSVHSTVSVPTSTKEETPQEEAPKVEASGEASKEASTDASKEAPEETFKGLPREALLHNFRHATWTNPYREKMPTTLMGRPKFNKSGKPATINVNSHRIEAYPTKTVYQYDVSSQPS